MGRRASEVLLPWEEVFVAHYVAGKSKGAAAAIAKPDAKNPGNFANAALRRPRVQEAILERRKAAVARVNVDEELIVLCLYREMMGIDQFGNRLVDTSSAARISAATKLGDWAGIWAPKRSKVRLERPVSEMSDLELRAVLQEIEG